MGYRCVQLAGNALLDSEPITLSIPDRSPVDIAALLSNMRIEAALVHSRALAYFLTKRSGTADVAAADYLERDENAAVVPDDLAQVARAVLGPVSNHLAHSKYPRPSEVADDGTPRHPGVWPITELALVLVGGVADVVAVLEPDAQRWFRSGDHTPHSLVPSLRDGVGSRRTLRSAHSEVQRLTVTLHRYLDRDTA